MPPLSCAVCVSHERFLASCWDVLWLLSQEGPSASGLQSKTVRSVLPCRKTPEFSIEPPPPFPPQLSAPRPCLNDFVSPAWAGYQMFVLVPLARVLGYRGSCAVFMHT